MAKLRRMVYAVKDYTVDPKDYDYAPDEEIRAAEAEHIDLPRAEIIVKVDLCTKEPKQFTQEHLKQLIATRGFLNVMCQWLEPDQIQDEEIRGHVALIQHLLNRVWGKLE
jgi:hypothetical protein